MEEYKLPYLDILREQHQRRIREGVEHTIQLFTDRLVSAENTRESLEVLSGVEDFVGDLARGVLVRHYLERKETSGKVNVPRTLPFEYRGYRNLSEAVEDFMKQNSLVNRDFAELAGVSFRAIQKARNSGEIDFNTISKRAKMGYADSIGRILESMDVNPPEKKEELWNLPPGFPEGYEKFTI
tara:strand:+ start:178 stop:726 length:549 start_codon:yes stop_codon:yes gene_type:complete